MATINANKKEVIASLKSAQSHMKAALDRIEELESAVRSSAAKLQDYTRYLPEYAYRSKASDSYVREDYKATITALTSVL